MTVDYSAFAYHEIDQMDGPPRRAWALAVTFCAATAAALAVAAMLGFGIVPPGSAEPSGELAIGSNTSAG